MTDSTTTIVVLASGATAAVPTPLITGDGVESPRFVGVSEEGYLLVEAYGMTYGLTPCCFASATGSMIGDEPVICCRACYEEVDEFLGGPMTVADATTL